MIAMGGCIGTGLFMTSGGAIHDAGALGALIAYAIIVLNEPETGKYVAISPKEVIKKNTIAPIIAYAISWLRIYLFQVHLVPMQHDL
jgi:L-asparagine transporter-like permease